MILFIRNLIVGTLSLIKGLFVTLKNLLTPAVTLQYPTQKLPMTQRYRGLVDLRVEKCIICYQCVKICPTGCLSITHNETAEKKKRLEKFNCNLELCCFCGLCQQVCPVNAIFLNNIYEIAPYSRAKLSIDLLKPEKYNEWAHPTVK